VTTTDKPVPRIPAAQWVREHTYAKKQQEEAERLRREQAEAKVKADASHLVDVFMLKVSEGKNPWKDIHELDMGEGEPAVLNVAKEELISLGYKARVDHPTDIGPGGRGQMTETWTNEKVWHLYVQRPTTP